MRLIKSKLSGIPICILLSAPVTLVSSVFAASTWHVDCGIKKDAWEINGTQSPKLLHKRKEEVKK